MYIICKFSGNWSLFNGKTRTSRILQLQEIELIKELFADDLRENAILDALQVISITANKLQQLSAADSLPGASKKPQMSGTASNGKS